MRDQRGMRAWWRALPVAASLLAALLPASSLAVDAQRGEQLFRTPPRPGDLACADCHSETPQVANFGGIWAGRNAPALIQRAIQINTGGMGYFQPFYRSAELADIAAWLGNTPPRLAFPSTAQGATTTAQTVTVSASLKQAMTGLSIGIEGDYVVTGNTCRATLPALSSCRVDVAFRPTGEGDRPGSLLIAHNGTEAAVRLALSGSSPRVPRAIASLTPARLEFGTAVLGAEAPQPRHALLSNTSADTLTIDSLVAAPADFTITGGSCAAGQRLRPGERCVIALGFAPRSGGERSGTLTVQHDGVGGSAILALSGSSSAGADERLVLTLRALDFGNHVPGQGGAERTLVWTQAGASSLAAVPVSVSDPRFTITHNACTGVVAPLVRCELRLAFAPTRAVASSAELRIGSQRVPLSGRLLAGPLLVAQPAALSFAEAASHTATRRLRLANEGAGALRLTRFAITGPEAGEFTLGHAAASDCRAGLSLAAGAACELELRFTPTAAAAAGARVARLTVDAEGSASGVTVELSGEADALPRSRPWPLVNHVDLGAIAPGTRRERRVLIENRGRAALRWHVLALSGQGAEGTGDWQRIDESSTDSCSPTRELAPQAACEVLLRFTAPALGNSSAATRRASLVLWPADRAAPALVSLVAHVAHAASAGGSWPGAESTTQDDARLSSGPSALVFEALVGRTGAPAVPVALSNHGAWPLTLAEFIASDAAFTLDAGGCRSNTVLMPGEHCSGTVSWSGAVPGGGAVLRAQADLPGAAAAIPLTVTEDPAQRSNVGAAGRGGGALSGVASAPALALLALAVIALRRAQRRGSG